MSTRISSALLICLLATACGSSGNSDAEPGQRDAAANAGRVVCALPGSDDFARQCTLDRTATEEGTVLTVHQPDGGFHRLLITRDGRGVVAADGAETAKVSVIGTGEIEVAIAGARYRLPATIGPVDKK